MKKNIITVFMEKIFSPGKSNISNKTRSPTTQETSRKVAPVAIDPAEPATSISLADQLYAEIAQGAAFLYAFETGDAAIAPAGMISSSHASTDGNPGYIRLANGNPDAVSGGHTDGYSIRLPGEIEAAASDHHIVVNIIARTAGNDQSRFAVAYSTNEVGNSGWRWFNAGAEWSVHTMEYDVPVMKNGNDDFVGILVEGKDHPGTEFCYLAITIS
jgi:hypothetical protein